MKSKLSLINPNRRYKTHDDVLVRCECGTTKVVRYDHFIKKESLSCGCVQKERVSKTNTKHGLTETDTFSIWSNMKNRCNNTKSPSYRLYGERGIKHDPRWEKFENFLKDMGIRPKGLTLERRNNNKGYSKENCYWATYTQQARNKRTSRIIEKNGIKKTVKEWAEELKISYGTLQSRYNKIGNNPAILSSKPVYVKSIQ